MLESENVRMYVPENCINLELKYLMLIHGCIKLQLVPFIKTYIKIPVKSWLKTVIQKVDEYSLEIVT